MPVAGTAALRRIRWSAARRAVLESGREESHKDPGLCCVKAQSSSFAPQAKRCKRPLTSRFVIPCCPLLSPRFC
jgi:hypothetical protein